MKRSALSLALLALLVVPGVESSRSVQAAAKPSQDQVQDLVQAHKNWSKQTFNQRLELMQRSQRCVDSSQSIRALKDCRDRYKQARRSLRQDRRAYLNQVREDVGLPARPKKKRRKQQV
ncbi:hypothetical protein [Synechococcus sp. A15-24]|uniref:hypothetical protein n=1 Tax=Synechococcus sp. A15-24 TaxID=1050635 RepID=UPI0016487AF9|nr:hypothetical protein [Synechococcus sp. A15-24]